LRAGATVGLAVERGRLVIEPTLRPRYSLDELLAQCDALADLSAEDRAWLDNKPVGNELL
jgi:antitoxin ChpS